MKKNSFALFLLLFLFSCGKEQNTIDEIPAIPVQTSHIEYKNITIPVHTSGILSSPENIKLAFKIGGIVDRIFVDEGESIKKGQVLAKLDLTEINAQVQQAQSGLEKWQRDFDRAQRLYNDGAATREQFQNAQTGLDVAQSQLKIAEFNLHYATIKAPASGKILKRFVEQGEIVGAGLPIFVFGSQNKSWIIRCGLADKDIVQLTIGDSAYVSFSAFPDKKYSAQVSELAENADPVNSTFEVELALSTNDKLISGFVGSVDIFPSHTEKMCLVSINALVEADGQFGFVFTIKNNIAKKIPVTTGKIIDDQIVINSGLENIEHIVTIGAPYLQDGSKVKVTN